MDAELKKKLLALTWDELVAWSDPRSVERGKKYVSNVDAPHGLPDGGLIAVVHGTHAYYTKLSVGENGQLQGVCSCPVGLRCKHCVALALVAAKQLKDGKSFPLADMASRKWRQAAAEFEDFEDDLDDEELEDEALGASADGEAALASAKSADVVGAHVASLDKTELRALVEELLANCSGVRPYLKHKLDVARSSTSDIVRRAREAIKDASENYYDRWDRYNGHDEPPDYSLVREYFEILAKANDARSLMELGDLLKRRASEQAECSPNDEGDIAYEVSPCMDIVAKAVMHSDMSAVAKVKWEDEIRSGDDYCVLSDMAVSYRTSLRASKKDWGAIADYLMKKKPSETESSWRWREDRARACEALERAGRVQEAVALLERETANDAQVYGELADLLLRLGRRAEASEWCRKGLAAQNGENNWNICDDLRRRLREMSAQDGDWKTVAAYDLDSHLDHLRIEDYRQLKASCAKVKCWTSVREALLAYLESGKAALLEGKKWPLPQTGTRPPFKQENAGRALLEIALEEKRARDVWSLYERLELRAKETADANTYGSCYSPYSEFGWRVADAVSRELPEKALEVWQAKIRANLSYANENCYQTICQALEKMRPVMKKLGRTADWSLLVDGLRTEYKRRRNFVAMLDKLTGKAVESRRISDW